MANIGYLSFDSIQDLFYKNVINFVHNLYAYTNDIKHEKFHAKLVDFTQF